MCMLDRGCFHLYRRDLEPVTELIMDMEVKQQRRNTEKRQVGDPSASVLRLSNSAISAWRQPDLDQRAAPRCASARPRPCRSSVSSPLSFPCASAPRAP